MAIVSTKKQITSSVMFVISVVWVWVYLFLNVASMEEGRGLYVLVGGLFFGSSLIAFKCCCRLPNVSITMFVFAAFVAWVAFRYVQDRGDFAGLFAISVGTTGGIVLFYFIGAILRECFDCDKGGGRFGYVFMLGVYLIASGALAVHFMGHLGEDLFFVNGAADNYQRPGNFMAIGFLIASYLFVSAIASSFNKVVNSAWNFIILILYGSSGVLELISSQAIGSNSATGVIFGAYVVSLSFFLASKNEKYSKLFARAKVCHLVFSKMLWGVFKWFVLGGAGVFAAALFLIWYLEFDMMKTRLFSFGEGGSTSIDSRFEIMQRWGFDQIGYSPFFGNVDVAYLVTGDAGITLHSFFPDVWASFGLVGLFLVMLLVFLVFRQLYRSAVDSRGQGARPTDRFVSLYSFVILSFLLIFANLTAGFSWVVLWFSLGFYSKSFFVRINSK